jgi:hypothetical protein
MNSHLLPNDRKKRWISIIFISFPKQNGKGKKERQRKTFDSEAKKKKIGIWNEAKRNGKGCASVFCLIKFFFIFPSYSLSSYRFILAINIWVVFSRHDRERKRKEMENGNFMNSKFFWQKKNDIRKVFCVLSRETFVLYQLKSTFVSFQ